MKKDYTKILDTLVSVGLVKSWNIKRRRSLASYISSARLYQEPVDIDLELESESNIRAIEGLYGFYTSTNEETSLLSIIFRDKNDKFYDFYWMMHFSGARFHIVYVESQSKSPSLFGSDSYEKSYEMHISNVSYKIDIENKEFNPAVLYPTIYSDNDNLR